MLNICLIQNKDAELFHLFEDYFIEIMIESTHGYKTKLKQTFDCKLIFNFKFNVIFKFYYF